MTATWSPLGVVRSRGCDLSIFLRGMDRKEGEGDEFLVPVENGTSGKLPHLLPSQKPSDHIRKVSVSSILSPLDMWLPQLQLGRKINRLF